MMNKGWSSFMERRVKERLVGASILVVLIVLFVPELLSGPKRAVVPPAPPGAALPMRSVTIDLATSRTTAGGDPAAATVSADNPAAVSADNAATGTVTPDAGAGGPAAPPALNATAAGPAGDRQPAAPAAAQAPDNTAASARPAVTAAKVEPTRRGWVAQLGSFAARDNAAKLERQLRSQGFAPVLSAIGAGPNLRFRVRIGPVADRSAADRLVVRLRLAGHPATLVAP